MQKKIGFGFLKKKWFLAAAIALFATVAAFLIFKARSGNYETVQVKRGPIAQEVEITGKTKSANNVDLAFERIGRVNTVNAFVGDKVGAGQALVYLDTNELRAQLLDAQANEDSQKAKLDELKIGARPEDIKVKETELNNAKQTLANDYLSALDVLNDAYAKTDDAVRKQTDLMFSSDEGMSPLLTFSTNNSQLETDVKALRANLTSTLNKWKAELIDLTTSHTDIALGGALNNAQKYLELIRSFIDKLSSLMGGSVSLTQPTIDTYRTSINTAKANINTAISNVNDQEQTIAFQISAVQKIQDELNLKLAGSTKEQIASQEAQLRQAEAKVALVNAQIQKSVLYSPITGTVTKQDLRVGEVASPNTTFLSIISENQLEIETDIPEISIGKIASGNKVEITLDAFPGETFTGKVFYIDPAETLVNGVVNFKVKIAFDKPDSRLKSGLTTNLIIQTANEPNTLILPIYIITEKDNGTFVSKLENGNLTEISVMVGLKDAKGNAQILSGVNEGDKIVNPLSVK